MHQLFEPILTECGGCVSGFVGVPKQLVITGDATSIPACVSAAGLKLPLGQFCTTRNNVMISYLLIGNLWGTYDL